jgi:hypothetical protein
MKTTGKKGKEKNETRMHIMQRPDEIVQILVINTQLAAQVVLQCNGESVCQN